MRGLIVGLGSIGRRHARNWQRLELGPLDVCHRDDDLSRALKQRPDLVFVTNPTSLHVATACAALDAGANVFVEKPLGHSLDGVADVLDRASRAGRTVTVGYNFRFHPGLVRLKALVQQNAIGKITSARAEVGEYLPNWHSWEDYRQSYSGRADLGGGAVLTFSHELDSLCWLLGPPRRLVAFTAHASRLEIDTEDTAEIVLEFPTGALASVHLDYVRRSPRRSLEVVGEEGILRWEYESNRVVRYAPATAEWRIEEGDPRFDRNDMYLAELRQLTSGAPGVLATGEEGAAVLAVALAALESARSGRAIDLASYGELVTTWLSSLGR